MKGIGFSWNNIRGKGKTEKMPVSTNMATPSETSQEIVAQFSETDLQFQWMAMCNRMPQQLSGIATRMKNMKPAIADYPHVEVAVDNELIKQEMEEIRGSIVKTLQINLRNTDITLSITVIDHAEEAKKAMTRRNQFEDMSKQNPAVEKLRQVFNLELA
jgi:DNA polymerase-3 subunit gamma/tau